MIVPEILFEEDAHKYTVEGIERVSVTTVLTDLGFYNFDGVPADVLEQARQRGKAIHAALHYLQEGDLDWSTVDPRIKPYLEAYQLFAADSGWRATLIESKVFSAFFNYVGTLDGLGEMAGLGIAEALIDLKSGIPQRAAAYQTAAYTLALGNPYIPRYSVHLQKTGRYKLIPHKDHNDIHDWKALVRTYHLKHRKD